MLASRKSTSEYVTEHTYLNGGEAERSTQSLVTKPFTMDDVISALAQAWTSVETGYNLLMD